ncbi:MAG: hypothetical protein Q8M95_16470 [Candidatus Methanoperedens sp.]|nr:hypothetical protein [Candidatus Methanoperedens sp.]
MYGKISKNSKIPGILRTKTFKLAIAGVMGVMFLIVLLGKNPFLVSQDKLASVGGFIVFICIVTTLLISIPLGIMFMPRTWCSFCPVGYAQSLLSKNKILQISIEDCKNCMKCTDACRIGVNKPVISIKNSG